jgi:hypothetical protein
VKNRFQNLPFKCNLQRYKAALMGEHAEAAAAAAAQTVRALISCAQSSTCLQSSVRVFKPHLSCVYIFTTTEATTLIAAITPSHASNSLHPKP